MLESSSCLTPALMSTYALLLQLKQDAAGQFAHTMQLVPSLLQMAVCTHVALSYLACTRLKRHACVSKVGSQTLTQGSTDMVLTFAGPPIIMIPDSGTLPATIAIAVVGHHGN